MTMESVGLPHAKRLVHGLDMLNFRRLDKFLFIAESEHLYPSQEDAA